uniref:Tc1-like transposase DDE domain-containing protein n=1 Tax=Anopheles christyi TaxID=43041 RepID=A0A182KHJ6_9DIPT
MVNLDDPDCCANYWHDLRKSHQLKLSRNFGGGSLMMWAAFSQKETYVELLDSVLIPFTEDNMDNNYIFQQDNAAIH